MLGAILIYGMNTGIIPGMRTKVANKTKTTRKITVELPADLIAAATEASAAGLTSTIRKGLELVAAADAYAKIAALRGKVKFSVNLKELRRDRS